MAEQRLENPYLSTTAKMKSKYRNIVKEITNYENSGSIERYPRRYPIAKYIKKHMKNAFDYGIFDEIHLLCGDSLQGNAFGNIVNSCWKTINLTGTLSNGYASGMFYLLFRTQSRQMLADGMDHDSIKKFIDWYLNNIR